MCAVQRAEHLLHLEGGETLSYERLLLATGAAPRQLAGLSYGKRIHALRTVGQAAAIRCAMREGQHLAILGGGFIGLELAAMGRKLGATVTLIEMQPRVLMRGVPERLALALQARHEKEGVNLVCGVGVESIVEDEARLQSRLPTVGTLLLMHWSLDWRTAPYGLGGAGGAFHRQWYCRR